jgi:hypothetical protein
MRKSMAREMVKSCGINVYLQQPQEQDVPQDPPQSHFLQEHLWLIQQDSPIFGLLFIFSVYHIFYEKGIKTI